MSNLDLSASPWHRHGEIETGLTKREHAAILLRVPESGDPDLDAMIRTAQRRDLAAQVLAGFAGASSACPSKPMETAIRWADQLLSALSHPVAEKEPT